MAAQQVVLFFLFFIVGFIISFVLNGKDKLETDYETADKVLLWLTPFAAGIGAGIIAFQYPGFGFLFGLIYFIIAYVIFGTRRIWVD
jgi:biotin transporter BioY